MQLDLLYTGQSQIIFNSSDDKFKIELVPFKSLILVDFDGNSFSGNPFALANPGWQLLSVSSSLIDGSHKLCVISLNGQIESGHVSSSPHLITGFVIGQTFHGVLRDFRIYTTLMGSETFSYPSYLDTYCASGFFYDMASQICLACHPNCLRCADATNTQCGVCVSGFQLATDGVAGQCLPSLQQCDDSCATCSGPQSNECLTCNAPYFLSSLTGPGFCIYACSQLSPDIMNVVTQCEERKIMVQLIQSFYQQQSEELIIHFSQALNFNNLNAQDFTVSGSNYEIRIMEHQLSPSHTYKVKLVALKSFNQEQTLLITLSSQNIGVLSDRHQLLSTYQLDPIERPPQYLLSPTALTMVQGAALATESVSLLVLVALIITQSYFQISFQMLWALLNFNQLVFIAPLINLDFPQFLFILALPLRFSIGDLFVLVMLYDFLFSDLLSSLPQKSFSPNFQLHDIPYMDILSNCGPLFLMLAIQLLLLFLYALLSCRFLNKCFFVRKVSQFCSGLKWSSFLRTFLQGMLELLLFSLLNIYLVLGSDLSSIRMNVPLVISFSLSCFIILALFLFAFGIFRILAREPVQLGTYSSPTYRIYGELYKNQNYSRSFCAKHYQVWFVLRRLLVIASLVLVPNGMVQLGILEALCIGELIILLKVKPFKSKADSAVSIICQFSLLTFYGCLGAIQFVNWRVKIILVWVGMGVVLLGNTLGFFILLYQKRMDCKRERKRKKQLIELKERASRKNDTSILSILQPVRRPCSNQQQSILTSVSSQRPAELSLFHPRNHYSDQNRRVGEVKLSWRQNNQIERETKIFQF